MLMILVELSNHDVSPQFIAELREMGFKDLDADDFVELRNHDISANFIRSLRELGLKDLDTDELVELRIHNVIPQIRA